MRKLLLTGILIMFAALITAADDTETSTDENQSPDVRKDEYIVNDWWLGSTTRLLSLGDTKSGFEDQSNLTDLYGKGFTSNYIFRQKKNLISTNLSYALDNKTDSDEFGFRNTLINIWLSDADAINITNSYNREYSEQNYYSDNQYYYDYYSAITHTSKGQTQFEGNNDFLIKADYIHKIDAEKAYSVSLAYYDYEIQEFSAYEYGEISYTAEDFRDENIVSHKNNELKTGLSVSQGFSDVPLLSRVNFAANINYSFGVEKYSSRNLYFTDGTETLNTLYEYNIRKDVIQGDLGMESFTAGDSVSFEALLYYRSRYENMIYEMVNSQSVTSESRGYFGTFLKLYFGDVLMCYITNDSSFSEYDYYINDYSSGIMLTLWKFKFSVEGRSGATSYAVEGELFDNIFFRFGVLNEYTRHAYDYYDSYGDETFNVTAGLGWNTENFEMDFGLKIQRKYYDDNLNMKYLSTSFKYFWD